MLKLFCNGKEAYLDCGYRINRGKGTAEATNWVDPSYECRYNGTSFTVRGKFNRISLKTSTPLLHVGLRGVALLAGNRIISMLKKKIILVDKHGETEFERDFELREDGIVIRDRFCAPEPVTIETAGNMSLRHVASGKFFMTSDLLRPEKRSFEQVNKLELQTSIRFQEKGVEIEYERLERTKGAGD